VGIALDHHAPAPGTRPALLPVLHQQHVQIISARETLTHSRSGELGFSTSMPQSRSGELGFTALTSHAHNVAGVSARSIYRHHHDDAGMQSRSASGSYHALLDGKGFAYLISGGTLLLRWR
jgi:hypothetical protein